MAKKYVIDDIFKYIIYKYLWEASPDPPSVPPDH